MVSNVRHAMIGCEYIAREFIVEEITELIFRFLHNVIYNLNVFHVFLQKRKYLKKLRWVLHTLE